MSTAEAPDRRAHAFVFSGWFWLINMVATCVLFAWALVSAVGTYPQGLGGIISWSNLGCAFTFGGLAGAAATVFARWMCARSPSWVAVLVAALTIAGAAFAFYMVAFASAAV